LEQVGQGRQIPQAVSDHKVLIQQLYLLQLQQAAVLVMEQTEQLQTEGAEVLEAVEAEQILLLAAQGRPDKDLLVETQQDQMAAAEVEQVRLEVIQQVLVVQVLQTLFLAHQFFTAVAVAVLAVLVDRAAVVLMAVTQQLTQAVAAVQTTA
jgi:hypothetical protein